MGRGVKGYYAVLASILAAGAVLGILYSPFFGVKNVTVEGISFISRDEVIFRAGIGQGENIFRLDTNAVRRRILALPGVRDARILRKLPSTIAIFIEERKPCALLPYGGYFVEVDPRGVALGIIETLKFQELPLVSGLAVDRLTVGQRVVAPGIDEVICVASNVSREMLRRISEIHAQYGKSITLYISGNIVADLGWGKEETLARRARLLEKLLLADESLAEASACIDLHSEKRPVIRLKKP